jgi:SAM-dependent methyltransferase
MSTERDFYERVYHFDDDVVHAGLQRLQRALRQLGPMSKRSFLDLGSGVGWAAHHAVHDLRAEMAVAVDVAYRPLALGSEFAPGPFRVQANGMELPFRSSSFDRVFSFGSVEHFPDVRKGLSEIARVLGADGTAVIVVPNFYVRTEQPQELTMTYLGWRRMIRSAGLEVVSTRADRGPKIFRDYRPMRIVFRAGGRILSFLPGLQYQFIFLLRKADSSQ